jgi:hypothetical protein
MLTDKELRAVKQVRASARAVVDLSASLFGGASQVRGSIAMLPTHLRFSHPAIDALLHAMPPKSVSGEVRLYLSDPELAAADAALSKVEAVHRQAVMLECKHLYFACSKLLHAHNAGDEA